MPAAVAAIGAVVASVGSAVASVVAPIVATIAAAVGPAVAAIGSVIGSITASIGSALAPIISTVGGIGEWVLTSIGQTVGGLVKTVGDTVTPFIDKLGEAIGTLTSGITKATEPILAPIKSGLEIIFEKVKAVEQWVTSAFHPSARLDQLRAAHPEVWAASDGSTIVFRDLLAARGIISSTEAALLGMPDVIQTVNQVATLKIFADLVKGQASVSDLLGKIADGKSFETAVAIAELSKSIVSTTVNLMDRVDTEIGILRAGIETFDERLETSVRDAIELQKAQILELVTPKVTLLGEHSLMVNRKIAQLARHVEDETWFAFMLVRLLSRDGS